MLLEIGCLKTFEDLGFEAVFSEATGLGHVVKCKTPTPTNKTVFEVLHFTS